MTQPAVSRVDVPFASFVKNGVVRLHHFAPAHLGESFETDPRKFGKNPWTQAERKVEGSPKTFFYLDPEADKEGFFGEQNAHYHVDYPAEHIYDVVADPEGFKSYSGSVHGLLNNIHEAGYHGVYYSGKFPTVALWRPAKVTRLARVIHGQQQMTAPPGGAIVDNMNYARGFLPKVRARIRDVASRIVKLARGDGKTNASGLVGKGEAYDSPLTLGQLKGIESHYGLSDSQKLSPLAKQHPDRTGDAHPYTVNIDHAIKFYGHLTRAAIGPGKLKKVLADPKVSDGEKHVHLVTNLLGDYTDAPKGDWYSGAVDALDVGMHKHFGIGKLDGTGKALEGKGAPHIHHPELVLFKTLIGMTSPLANPIDNTRYALEMWKAGVARAKANGSDDVIGHLPHEDTDGLKRWLDKLAKLHGTTADKIPHPGTSALERAKWYAKWVHPHAETMGQEGQTGYAAQDAVIYVHPKDSGHQHHGVFKSVSGKKGTRNPAAPVPSKTAAEERTVALPLVNPDGSLRAKGWGKFGKNTAGHLKRLKEIIDRYRTPNGGTKEAYQKAAEFLFSFHPEKDFTEEELSRVYKGFFQRGEKVPGFMVFGPKIGAFMANLHAHDPATRASHGAPFTHDTWMQRQFLSHLGRLTTDKASKSVSSNDRAQFRKAAEALADHLKITPAELQADLWYYAQGLMRRLGVRADRIKSYSFRDAANRFLLARAVDPRKFAELKAFMPTLQYKGDGSPLDRTAHRVFADWVRETTGNTEDPRAQVVERAGESPALPDTLDHPLFEYTPARRPNAHGGLTFSLLSPDWVAEPTRRVSHARVRWTVPTGGSDHRFTAYFTPEEFHALADRLPATVSRAWKTYATTHGMPDPRGATKLARTTLHADLSTSLGGKTWKRHNKRVAIQKHGDGGISVLMHGKKVVTAWPDGTTKKHGGKFYTAPIKLGRTPEYFNHLRAASEARAAGDQTPALAFADHTDEAGEPGAEAIRQHSPAHVEAWSWREDVPYGFGKLSDASFWRVGGGYDRRAIRSTLLHMRPTKAQLGPHSPALLRVTHVTPGGEDRRVLASLVPIRDLEHAHSVTRDWPTGEREKLIKALRAYGVEESSGA